MLAGRGRGDAGASGSRDCAPRPKPTQSCSPHRFSSPPGEPDPGARMRRPAHRGVSMCVICGPLCPGGEQQAQAGAPGGNRRRQAPAAALAVYLGSAPPPPCRRGGRHPVSPFYRWKNRRLYRVTSSLKTQWKRTLLSSSPADLHLFLFGTKMCPTSLQCSPCARPGGQHWGQG